MNKTISNKTKKNKDPYYDEARSLFISGFEPDQIAKTLNVSLQILREWQTTGQWERKKELVAEHPKLIGETLKGLVKQRVEIILDDHNQINIQNIDELAKIINIVERLEENSWDERAAVVAVIGLFGEFARRQLKEKEELQLLAKLIEKFFEELEES